MNVHKLSNSEFAFVITSKHALLGVFISTIVKCDLLRIVITLHHSNFLSKRSKPRRHQSPIRGKSIFHLVICSFRVSSCDKKNLKWIFIPYDVLWNELCVLYPRASGDIYIYILVKISKLPLVFFNRSTFVVYTTYTTVFQKPQYIPFLTNSRQNPVLIVMIRWDPCFSKSHTGHFSA